MAVQRFKDAARELGADDDVARFEARLGKLARAKPAAKPKRKRPGR